MSYGTNAGFTAWLATMGFVLPANSPTPDTIRARGSAYINAVYGPVFCGVPEGGFLQEDVWPRIGGQFLGTDIPPGAIPPQVEQAAYWAGYLSATGVNLFPASDPTGRIKRQKVEGAVEREFFEGRLAEIGGVLHYVHPGIDGLLRPFLCLDTGDDGLLGFWSIGS